MSAGTFRRVAWAAVVLCFCVVVMGAWVRLSDAGLGCPDWPGCYGQLTWPGQPTEVHQANAAFPDQPFEPGKAWREMVHRYAAGALGLAIFSLALMAWRRRREPRQPLVVPMILVGLVIFQALLGMWTVTLQLHPVIVMAHLLGGLATLSLLVWTALSSALPKSSPGASRSLYGMACIALGVMVVQIALGGWTSANYAAMACPDFPTCQDAWWPRMDFSAGFDLVHPVGVDYEFGVMDLPARTAIHFSHRMWALVTALTLLGLAILCLRRGARGLGTALLVLLAVQLSLGVANVLLRLPMPVAVGHNAVAAALLALVVASLYRSRRHPAPLES